MDPHQQKSNYEVFISLTGVDPAMFTMDDMSSALEMAMPFIDDHYFEINTVVERLLMYLFDTESIKDTTVNTKMKMYRCTPMIVAYVMGYAMGKKAEKQSVTLDKLLKGFKVEL